MGCDICYSGRNLCDVTVGVWVVIYVTVGVWVVIYVTVGVWVVIYVTVWRMGCDICMGWSGRIMGWSGRNLLRTLYALFASAGTDFEDDDLAESRPRRCTVVHCGGCRQHPGST